MDKEGVETHFHIIEKTPHESLVFSMENDKIEGTWTGKFYPQGDKTTLDFTEELQSKKLTIKPFINFYREKQKQYFKDLKQELHCEEASFEQSL